MAIWSSLGYMTWSITTLVVQDWGFEFNFQNDKNVEKKNQFHNTHTHTHNILIIIIKILIKI